LGPPSRAFLLFGVGRLKFVLRGLVNVPRQMAGTDRADVGEHVRAHPAHSVALRAACLRAVTAS